VVEGPRGIQAGVAGHGVWEQSTRRRRRATGPG
jgi:hypothetical protein